MDFTTAMNLDFSTISKLQKKGYVFLIVGGILRLISFDTAFGDIANIVMLYGLVHISIHLWETRNDMTAEEKAEIELYQEFLERDERRKDLPRDEARAAFIAWRDSRHYTV